MRITYKGDYALKTILDLAVHYGAGPVTIHELAQRADTPIKFLEQILLDLKRGGFVESSRGKLGGYILAKPPGKIKLGEVIRYIDGPIEPILCTGDKYSGCKDLYSCVYRNIWKDVAKATSDIIDEVNFEDLANRVKTQAATTVYQI